MISRETPYQCRPYAGHIGNRVHGNQIQGAFDVLMQTILDDPDCKSIILACIAMDRNKLISTRVLKLDRPCPRVPPPPVLRPSLAPTLTHQ